MAEIRTHAPATGTMGNSPATFRTDTLPRWSYMALAVACACMGAWCSIITLRYFQHGAVALEADPAMQALAVSAAIMFVASEMSAFALAALLTERQLWARRWMLYGFAGAVLALEVATIVSVQLALTSGADLAQNTVQVQEADLRARITALEAGAAAKRADAESQRAAGQLTKAARSGDKATAEQAQTAALYDQLAQVQAQKRPTLVGLLGETNALAYAIARGVLVSLGGLVFFGVAGALLRVARGGALSTDQQILALLHELRGTPGAAPAHMAMQIEAAPAGQVPTLAPSFKPAGTVTPKNASTGFSYGSKAALVGAAGVGLMAATGAPVTHAAPAVPAAAGASEQSHFAGTERHHAGAAEKPGQSEAEQAHSGATEQAHPASPSTVQKDASKRAWTATAVPDGDKLDSAVSGKGATRYNRVKAAVKAGRLKPSMRAIQLAEGGGGIVVRRYLQALEKEGVIVRKGRGFVTVTKVGGSK